MALPASGAETPQQCFSLFSSKKAETNSPGRAELTKEFLSLLRMFRDSPQNTEIQSKLSLSAKKIFLSAGIQFENSLPSDQYTQPFTHQQMRFLISPTGTHPLNKFAASIKGKMNVDLIYSIADLVLGDRFAGGMFDQNSLSLYLDYDLPLSLKSTDITGHEVVHALFEINARHKKNSYLRLFVSPPKDKTLPLSSALTEYTNGMTFEELWTYLASLRISFNHAKRAQALLALDSQASPESGRAQSAPDRTWSFGPLSASDREVSWRIERFIYYRNLTRDLYSDVSRFTGELLTIPDHKWVFILRSPTSVSAYTSTSDFQVGTMLFGPDITTDFRINNGPQKTLELGPAAESGDKLSQLKNKKMLSGDQAPHLTSRIRQQLRQTKIALEEGSDILKEIEILTDELKIHDFEYDTQDYSLILAEIDKKITELRKVMRPLAFPDTKKP